MKKQNKKLENKVTASDEKHLSKIKELEQTVEELTPIKEAYETEQQAKKNELIQKITGKKEIGEEDEFLNKLEINELEYMLTNHKETTPSKGIPANRVNTSIYPTDGNDLKQPTIKEFQERVGIK